MTPAAPLHLVLALAVGAACRSGAPAPAASPPPADLILVGGKVFTADPARPWAAAIAVRGERIAAVGSDEQVRVLVGSGTRVVELAGRTVVPGINDAHVHEPWVPSGQMLDIAADASANDVLAAVRDGAMRATPGAWLRGPFPLHLLDDPRVTRVALDEVAPDHPVGLTATGGHAALVNSAGLRALGIGERAPDPPGGRYGRRGAVLDGWLYEHAIWVHARTSTEALSDDELRASCQRFADDALRVGITSVQTMPALGGERIERLAAMVGGPLRWRWIEMRMASLNEAPRLPIKYVLDGTPMERGAAVREPYVDRPEERGVINYEEAQISRMVEIAAGGGPQLLVHASGDRAIEAVLAAMERTPADWPARRVRIEHGDFVGPLADRAARLGAIVVQNPSHLMLADVLAARHGTRTDYQVLRSLLDRGVPLALGSDGPTNPWLNVMFATQHPRNPGEALSREQAVVAYTRGAAFAEGAEQDKGTLAPGMLADLAVLSQDVFTVPADALPATESVLTIVGGAIAWEAPGAAAGFE
jgi:predicted amidohydrolase YtcJ